MMPGLPIKDSEQRPNETPGAIIGRMRNCLSPEGFNASRLVADSLALIRLEESKKPEVLDFFKIIGENMDEIDPKGQIPKALLKQLKDDDSKGRKNKWQQAFA